MKPTLLIVALLLSVAAATMIAVGTTAARADDESDYAHSADALRYAQHCWSTFAAEAQSREDLDFLCRAANAAQGPGQAWSTRRQRRLPR
jgi:hypothetical protein